jgi:hypothetical protein
MQIQYIIGGSTDVKCRFSQASNGDAHTQF